MIICADLNQEPNSQVCQTITGQKCVNSKLTDPNQNLQFESAYVNNTPEFTNFVPGFVSTVDYILYRTNSPLKCLRIYPVLTKSELLDLLKLDNDSNEDSLGLPNKQFPSDHIALIADFKLLS